MSDETKALSQYIAYNEMETNTMVKVTIAVPTLNGYDKYATAEYEQGELMHAEGEPVESDFIVLVHTIGKDNPANPEMIVFDEDDVGTCPIDQDYVLAKRVLSDMHDEVREEALSRGTFKPLFEVGNKEPEDDWRNYA